MNPDLETTIRAFAAVSFLLYLTPGIRPFGVSKHVGQRLQRAAVVLLSIGMLISIVATIHWIVQRL
jgi:VanZ family protein